MSDSDFGPYSKKVMELFENPKNVGEIKPADGIGKVGNPVCLAPNSLIITNPSIEEISLLKKTDKVLGHDGKFHKVGRVFKRKYKGDILTISTHNLGKTTLTPDHLVYAVKIGSRYKFTHKDKFFPDWYQAKDLEKGDFILYPILKETVDLEYINFDVKKERYDFKSKDLPKKIKIDRNFLRIIGFYLSEGYTRTDRCKGTIGFTFGSKEEEYEKEILSLMEKVFGLSSGNIVYKNNSINIPFYSARLARFFSDFFGKGAEFKKLPLWAMILPTKKQKEIIYSLWRGDGYINNKQAKFVTISKTLAHQLKVLLLRQRIIFSFLVGKAYGIHKKYYSFYIKDKNSLNKLSALMRHKFSYSLEKKNNHHKTWFNDDYYLTPIWKIEEETYAGEVNNLEVAVSHSYTTGNLAVHNCGDVMLLTIKVGKNGDREIIEDIKFKTLGCAAAIATSSMITDMAKGKNLEEAYKIEKKDVSKELGGLPPIKEHCSNLAADALKKAIEDYRSKK